LRVFRYASASPFHLTRYETKQNKPTPKDPQKGSTNLTKYWQRKGDHFTHAQHFGNCLLLFSA
jgi:hypothetical protein